jgi:hypothetical protein
MHHCAHLTSRCLRGLRPTYDMQLSDPVIRHLALFLCTTPHRLRHHEGAGESRDAACGEGEHSLRAAAPEGASECQRQGMRARRVRRLRSRVGARAHLAEGLEHGTKGEPTAQVERGPLRGGLGGGPRSSTHTRRTTPLAHSHRQGTTCPPLCDAATLAPPCAADVGRITRKRPPSPAWHASSFPLLRRRVAATLVATWLRMGGAQAFARSQGGAPRGPPTSVPADIGPFSRLSNHVYPPALRPPPPADRRRPRPIHQIWAPSLRACMLP